MSKLLEEALKLLEQFDEHCDGFTSKSPYERASVQAGAVRASLLFHAWRLANELFPCDAWVVRNTDHRVGQVASVKPSARVICVRFSDCLAEVDLKNLAVLEQGPDGILITEYLNYLYHEGEMCFMVQGGWTGSGAAACSPNPEAELYDKCMRIFGPGMFVRDTAEHGPYKLHWKLEGPLRRT